MGHPVSIPRQVKGGSKSPKAPASADGAFDPVAGHSALAVRFRTSDLRAGHATSTARWLETRGDAGGPRFPV